MCGIAGYLSAPGERPDERIVRAMCDRIVHRGPDGHGYFTDSRIALGQRRLSIIDVEGGRQPLANEDGSLQIIFNGEIYNYQELMDGLKSRGHVFQTRSDTEVMVHLYEEVGERLPEYLNGMFALAIWDTRNQTLFAARDRFGEKPFYWSDSIPGMAFCFASELKAMTWLNGFPAALRPESVADFLNFSYVPDPHTIYASVHKLEPACSMTIRADGSRRITRYWTPRFALEAAVSTPAASLDQLDALAGDAVRSRMVSDVPLGGFLSGGVDSSAVVAYMARSAPGRVRTFSIGFTAREFDELEYARLIASQYNTDHYEEVVTPSIEETLATLVRHYDEPFGDSSAIPTLYLSRMTRKFVTVALSGDGADELFGGYRRYAFALSEERVRALLPEGFRRHVVGPLGAVYPKFDYLPRIFRAKATLEGISSTLAGAYFNVMSRFRDEGLAAILSAPLRQRLDGYSCREAYCARFREYSDLPPLSQLQAVDWRTYLPGDILVKVDRATMAYSLESRAPWLDHRLAELAAALPTSGKVRGHTGKAIFKQVARRYIPSTIIDRAKMGFSVPLAAWFRTSLKPVFEKTVLAPAAAEYLDLNTAAALWRQHQSGVSDHSTKLWNLLMLACWDACHRRGETDLF